MQFVDKEVVNGSETDSEGNKVAITFGAPIAEFESISDAVQSLGERVALKLLNDQADIKSRAVHRQVHSGSKGAKCATREQVLESLKTIGLGAQRSASGVPASEAAKVEKLMGRYIMAGEHEKALELGQSFENDPKGTIERLYAEGTLKKGKPKAKKETSGE